MESKKVADSEYFQTIGRKGGLAKSDEKTKAARDNGQKGGLVTSERKRKAVQANGRKGGRKPLPIEKMTDDQKKRRERYQAAKIKNIYSDL